MDFNKESMQSNLQCFLDHTTPIVPSQYLPKSAIRNLNQIWHPCDTEKIEYFTLEDLWRCYEEWSVYGVGVPIALNKDETVVQYYVPYLSAIQIFTSLTSLTSFRIGSLGGDSEARDSSSESCSDENESEKSWCGSSNDSGFEQERLCNQNEKLGYLYFQYFERLAPCGRVPLMDKVNGLAQRFHGLMNLKSIDLSPASWMAVSWYPIYHIPTKKTVKDLSTCFLTFHTLSSSFQGAEEEMGIEERKTRKREGLALPSFGLATYKLQGNVWLSGEDGGDQERLLSLFSAADSWLKQLGVQHHDFNYFTGIRQG